MIISSWNVNSIRARIENIKEYLKKFSPDVVLVQEIKTEDKTFPYDEIKLLDYECYVFGQKSYNGVAILSKKKLSNIKSDTIKDKNKQSRIISADMDYKKKKSKLLIFMFQMEIQLIQKNIFIKKVGQKISKN